MRAVSGPPAAPKMAAVILAAGASSRLGRPKQTVVLGNETLVERAVRVAVSAGFGRVGVVVNDAAWVARLASRDVAVLLNPEFAQGMSRSIAVAVRWAQGLAMDGVVLMTCDQVAVTTEHLRALCVSPEEMVGSGYAGKVGIPAYFPAFCFEKLIALRGDAGAREMLQNARAVMTEALAFDVDTEQDLERARQAVE